MQQGNINVSTENIFPIIKKFLYSDHEIFLRELVSNAVDATQKLTTLSSVGEFKGDIGDKTVKVSIDAEKGTLTISDRGVGMTGEEVEKYINQIAFSGAEEFVDKYKDQAAGIIGHFGLGFYSSFMVSTKVEIVTKSFKDDAKAVKWSCDGSPSFTLDEVEKEDRGTDIILYIDDESKEFLEQTRIQELLSKYCKFLPVSIAFGKRKDYKDGKEVETDEDNMINNTSPAWTKKPAELKAEDYDNFYKELYPISDDPLFHIHLNVDYPFNLTGILYFPKLKNNIEVQRNKIQLYSNQVYVTDSVEGIVPEFLTLLHGVIDSPDIPLNVSRSYLQADGNVKKISNHITKKVADRLSEIFKNDRNTFEDKWDDMKVFVQYGMLSEDKFYEKAEKYSLLKSTDGKYFTHEEYQNLVKDNQTDKNNNLIYLYATDAESQFSYINKAKDKGYDVLLMDGQLDSHFIQQFEQKNTGTKLARVDGDIVEKLIEKDEKIESKLSTLQQQRLTDVFKGELPNKDNYVVVFESLQEQDRPTLITQSEFMRRMKEMSASGGGGMSFYGDLPDSYNLVVNANHALVLAINEELEGQLKSELETKEAEIAEIEKSKAAIQDKNKDKKEEEFDQADKDAIEAFDKQLDAARKVNEEKLMKFGSGHTKVKQLIDLALLANNMLTGEDLDKFVKRSLELI